ncbi:MAG: carbamoyltransferase HypF [Phycisphaerae bacterium]|nr:carbamoyltransferase HypF [Phycisphaerae bacterium]
MSIPTDAVLTLPVPDRGRPPVLALGADLKNTICLLRDGQAHVSRDYGDLSNAANFRSFRTQTEAWKELGTDAELVLAHDMHPAFASTAWAAAQTFPRIGVQHHHAHMVAVMAEHDVRTPVVGIICDGTGWGTDGAVWGGEVLCGDECAFDRCSHIEYFPLPGGDAAARQTWRPALSLVDQAYEHEIDPKVAALFDRVEPESLRVVGDMLRRGFNCPPTSSLGRLFDAVAFLVGCCDANDVEGLAPMRLESIGLGEQGDPYPFATIVNGSGPHISIRPMIRAICDDVISGTAPAGISGRFHSTVASMFAAVAIQSAASRGLDTAVLSGGCMLNRTLVTQLQSRLLGGGFRRVLIHERLSPGDAGLSVGQAVAAAGCGVR